MWNYSQSWQLLVADLIGTSWEDWKFLQKRLSGFVSCMPVKRLQFGDPGLHTLKQQMKPWWCGCTSVNSLWTPGASPCVTSEFFLVHLCTPRNKPALCLVHSAVWSVGAAVLVVGTHLSSGGFFVPFSAESRHVRGHNPAEGDLGGLGKAKLESLSAPSGSWGTDGFCSEFHL